MAKIKKDPKPIELKGERVRRRLNNHIVTIILPEKRITPEEARQKAEKLMAQKC